jgi:hypothetical protein
LSCIFAADPRLLLTQALPESNNVKPIEAINIDTTTLSLLTKTKATLQASSPSVAVAWHTVQRITHTFS